MRLVLPALAALLGCASSPSQPGAASDASRADLVAMDAVAVMDAPVAPEDAPVAPEDAPMEAAADVPTVAGPYPEGPYGNREGAVLANLAWEGYVNADGAELSTALPFGPTTLQELRGDGRGYALIHLAEFL